MNLKNHCYLGFFIRLVFIFVGLIQDFIFEVNFTDIDYKVFTDAARYVYSGKSPYNRHTYRYSPIISYLLVPNLFTYDLFGKILFSFCDILMIDIIYKILKNDGVSCSKCKFYSFFWLYNPLSIVISTRGNADSFPALFVLMTILKFKEDKIFLAGLFHGIAIHLRLYPIVFSLPLYFAIEYNHENRLLKWFFPSKSRLILVFSCLSSLTLMTCLFYYLYGWRFMDESFLYHLRRVDIRHNYSAFFYLQYLTSVSGIKFVGKCAMLLPQLILILLISCRYGNKRDIAFCQMTLAFVMVAFNSVITCQYFIWYLSLVPLCLYYMNCKKMEMVLVGNFWVVSQVAWLLPAYLLEFKSQDTFFYIWLQGLVFFWANIVVLSTCIRNYNSKSVDTKLKTN